MGQTSKLVKAGMHLYERRMNNSSFLHALKWTTSSLPRGPFPGTGGLVYFFTAGIYAIEQLVREVDVGPCPGGGLNASFSTFHSPQPLLRTMAPHSLSLVPMLT